MRDPSTPRPAKLPLTLLAVGMLAIALDVGAARITFGVALPAYTRELGLSFTAAGLLGSIHLIGYLIGTLVSPALSGRLGNTYLCRTSHVVFALGMFTSGLPQNFTAMAIGRLVSGLSAGCGVFAIFAIVFSATSPQQRATAGSWVWAGIGVAILISGVMSPFLVETRGLWRFAFIVPAALALCVAYFLPAGDIASAPDGAVASLSPGLVNPRSWKSWIFLSVAYVSFGMAYIAFATFAGVRLRDVASTSGTVSQFWMMFGVASMLGSWLGAVLLSRPIARRFALCLAFASGSAGAAAATGAGSGLLAASLLVGLGLVAIPALTTITIRQRSDEFTYPRTFSVVTAIMGVGQLVGPGAAGLMADHFGAAAVALFASWVYAGGAIAALADGVYTIERKPHLSRVFPTDR